MRGKAIFLGGLLLLAHFMPAQAGDPYQSNNSGGTDEVSQQRWSAWRRAALRQGLDVLLRRFSPEQMAQAGFSPEQARAFIVPVAGEGSVAEGWSLWTSASWLHMRQNGTAVAGKGYALSGSHGLDKALSDWLTAGVSLSITRSKARDRASDTWERTWQEGVALYADVRLNEWLGLSVQGGPVWQQQRFRDGSAIGLVRGKRRSLGWMASATLSAQRWLSPAMLISGRISLLGAYDHWQAHTVVNTAGATTTRPARTEALMQGVAEGGVSLWLAPVMPYLRVAYGRDLYRHNIASEGDRDDFTFTGGLSWFGTGRWNGLSLDLSASARVGRKHEREQAVALGVRWGW